MRKTWGESAALTLGLLIGMASVGCGGESEDKGSCLMGTPTPDLCLNFGNSVSNKDGETGCSILGTWQEIPCALENAIGECSGDNGASSVYYPEYLTTYMTTEAELRMTCAEDGDDYTDL